MATASTQFLEDAESRVFDPEHRRKLAFNILQYDKKVEEGKNQYKDFDAARQRANFLKWRTIEKLDKHLIEFEANFIKRGGKVICANDAQEAMREIVKILTAAGAKTVVKSKSMTTEEIHVNAGLTDAGIESIETDLGEFIVQLRDEPPYHIVTPAMHRSKENVAKLFHDKKGTAPELSPEQLTGWTRNFMKEKAK